MAADDADPSNPEPSGGPNAVVFRALLVLAACSFLGFCFALVPRLTNTHFGDLEFTGWSGPMGSRIVAGDVVYRDFVLPIPPGSFAALALIERIAGAPRLLHELWLNAGIHLVLGFIGFIIARPLTSRFNAVLVATATWIGLTYLNKECAYDHTAQLFSWSAVAIGLHALLASSDTVRKRLFVLTGLLGGVTFAFKQSTGVGAVGCWLLGLTYLAGVEQISGNRERARALVWNAGPLLAGAAGGLLLVWLLLVGLGSSFSEYFAAVFRDGSDLKGGSFRLVGNLLGYLLRYEAFPASLGIVLLLAFVGARLAAGRRIRLIGDTGDTPTSRRSIFGFAAATVVTFGAGAWALIAPVPPMTDEVNWGFDALQHLPSIGLMFAGAFFLAHLKRIDPDDEDAVRKGHVFNALLLVALAASMLHNTSAPEFRPFYDNNPIIPVAFLYLFATLDQARLPHLKMVGVALVFLSLYGDKFNRALAADTYVGDDGHWAGMRVSTRGETMFQAARRARELAGEDGTVLVLPEDVQLTALIGGKRPPIQGAIAFVDQYPRRVLEHDLKVLTEQPPKVLVIHPADVFKWMRFYRIWSGDSAAEQLLKAVAAHHLRQGYVLDSTFETKFYLEDAKLQIWVRR